MKIGLMGTFLVGVHGAEQKQGKGKLQIARMCRVDRNWTKSGGRPSPMAGGFVSG